MARITGSYVVSTTLGEPVRAFVPHALPPANPPLAPEVWQSLNAAAVTALQRLSAVAGLVPSVDWLLYSAIRQEALLTSQIEGTQATLVDLFDEEAGLAISNTDDVEEVTNYLRAFQWVQAQLRSPTGLPISVRLLSEAHRLLLNGARGAGKQPGELRRSQNWIGGTRPGNAVFVPPPAERVPRLLGDLERFIHAEAVDLPLAALRRPGAALRTAVQSLPNVAITTPVTIAGGLAGAALGAPGSPVGSIVGAVATGGAANAAIEVGYALNDLLNERTGGASATMTEEQIAAYLEANPDIVDEAQRIGLTRGATIGAVEALGLKGAGRLTAAPARAAEQAARTALAREGVDLASQAAVRQAMATPALRQAAETAAKAATDQFNLTGRALGAVGIEAGAAAGGELAAQAAAGQELDYGEAFLETLGEGLAAPATVLAARSVDMPRGSVLRLPATQQAVQTAAAPADAAAAASGSRSLPTGTPRGCASWSRPKRG
jgi:hypothetical protein